jgi:hypothetical protein
MDVDLENVREWAARRIGAGQETPWDWYQLMKLQEALDALIQSDRARRQTADLPRQEPRWDERLQASVAND